MDCTLEILRRKPGTRTFVVVDTVPLDGGPDEAVQTVTDAEHGETILVRWPHTGGTTLYRVDKTTRFVGEWAPTPFDVDDL